MKVTFNDMEIELQVVTEDRLEEIAEWAGGSLHGIRLPRKDQEILIYGKHFGELSAYVGDSIVKFISPLGMVLRVFTKEEVQILFK